MKSFSSKLLLFGEHMVNRGAQALAIPYPKFYASLSYDLKHPDYLAPSNEILLKMLEHIRGNDTLAGVYNLEAFDAACNKGLGFLMNIPIGYGLGSSGAIVAAVFDEFAYKKEYSLHDLKEILGETEGVFHGKSSGLDPLVSYVNQAVLVGKETKIIEQKLDWEAHFSIFLLDTQQARKTAPLVNAFLKKVDEDTNFAKVLQEEIIPINNAIIEDFLNEVSDTTFSKIAQLSALQYQYFDALILEEQKSIWLKGLEEKTYFLKVCGAGGGGFILGFAKNKEVVLPFEVTWIK